MDIEQIIRLQESAARYYDEATLLQADSDNEFQMMLAVATQEYAAEDSAEARRAMGAY